MRKNTKGICDQVKSQRRIRAAYEDKNNKGRIDYKRRQYPLELYQDRIKKCDLATYGQRIRDLRKEKGVSQKNFCRTDRHDYSYLVQNREWKDTHGQY